MDPQHRRGHHNRRGIKNTRPPLEVRWLVGPRAAAWAELWRRIFGEMLSEAPPNTDRHEDDEDDE